MNDETMKLIGEVRRRHAAIAAETEPDPAGVALLERYSADVEEITEPE